MENNFYLVFCEKESINPYKIEIEENQIQNFQVKKNDRLQNVIQFFKNLFYFKGKSK